MERVYSAGGRTAAKGCPEVDLRMEAGKCRRILLVDDDKRVLFILRDVLIGLGRGYEIVTAGGGREALARIGEMRFDLVITDLVMPDVDGIAFTQHVRDAASDTAVIWMTAHGCHRVRAEAARLAVYCCLEKPVEVGRIRQTVREALEAVGCGKD
jgi:DNA-binding NtrC family response regulator